MSRIEDISYIVCLTKKRFFILASITIVVNLLCSTESTIFAQQTTPAGCGFGYDNSTCNTQQQTTPAGCGFGYDNSTCSSLQENEINYTGIYQTVQPVLMQSCSTLVYDNGSLTANGTHAMHCIRNGILLGSTALILHPNPAIIPLLLKGLSMLAAPTGCNGIVDMSKFDLLGHIGSLSSILKFIS